MVMGLNLDSMYVHFLGRYPEILAWIQPLWTDKTPDLQCYSEVLCITFFLVWLEPNILQNSEFHLIVHL